MHAKERVLTAAQMRGAEQALIDAGVSVDELMQRAGRGAAEWVWRLSGGRSVTVLCGPGNNGGDGYVIAQALRALGGAVSVVAAAEPATDAARNARSCYQGEVLGADADQHAEVLVDCLFGTGLTRPLSDAHCTQLQRLAHRHRHRVAIDLPSGVSSDDGALLNAFLPQYDLTIALGAWKRAHWLMPAMELMGERRLVDIGLQPVDRAPAVLQRPHLQAPAANAHKYSRGLVGIIGGAMRGAGVLAARAAMHGGAGYVRLFREYGDGGDLPDLVIQSGNPGDFLADRRFSALLIGPGLGRDDGARERLAEVLRREVPTVIDGDALHLLDPAQLSGRREGLILTPHAGELEKLYEACEIEPAERTERLLALAHDTRGVVIAKGSDTLIAASDGTLEFAASAMAPSWLSVAGSGDVLAGLAASRIAVGRTLVAAAREAVWLHGEAARLAGPAFTASELAAKIKDAYAACL